MEPGIRNLQEWIAKQMKDRSLSLRGFAELIGASHSTVRDHLRGQSAPTIDFLYSLAKATNTSMVYLIAIAFPENAQEHGIDLDTLILWEQLVNLSPEQRKLVARLASGDASFRQAVEAIEGLPDELYDNLIGIAEVMKKNSHRDQGAE